MPYVIGIVVSAGVALFGRYAGFDRDRAFYPTIMIVIAAYYVLFATISGSVQNVLGRSSNARRSCDTPRSRMRNAVSRYVM